MQPVIELTNVTKLYGQAVGTSRVSLAVEKGSVYGFLGPNGAGKSTTINMLLDFIRPTSGTIKLFGLDAHGHSTDIRRRIGFLAGDMAMDAGLTGHQALEYYGNLRGKFDAHYVRELSERLDCNLNRKFKHLSRGNRQKVGLIAALMSKPELLILDEPTSGLDPLIQAEFNQIILERKEEGTTTFVSSHVLSEVQEICDTVTFIRLGKIVDTKTLDELIKASPKQLTVRAEDLAGLKRDINKLPGAKATQTDHTLKATYSGDVNKLLQVLARHKLSSLSLEDTDLETTFMKYYERGRHGAAPASKRSSELRAAPGESVSFSLRGSRTVPNVRFVPLLKKKQPASSRHDGHDSTDAAAPASKRRSLHDA